MGRRVRAALALFFAVACIPAIAAAADLKAQVSGALKLAFPDIVAAFEKQTGNKVAVLYGPGGAIAVTIGKGEVADVAIVPSDLMEKLAAQARSSPAARWALPASRSASPSARERPGPTSPPWTR